MNQQVDILLGEDNPPDTELTIDALKRRNLTKNLVRSIFISAPAVHREQFSKPTP